MPELDQFSPIVYGFLVNLTVLFLSFPLAYAVGLILFLAISSAPGPIKRLLETLNLTVRITPVVVQLVIAYFALAAIGLSFTALTVAVMVFTIHYASFFVEKFRSSYSTIGGAQIEVAYTLGLSRSFTALRILIPQLVIYTYSATVNGILGMVKDSAILSVIAVTDAIQAAKILAMLSFDYVGPFATAGALFCAFYALTVQGARFIERILRERYGDFVG
ncbi:MAG: ABC transporter permease subunit [Rhodospirillales bacterium]|nr:ABC transporter permease subunit [Rhodospirillales bacterium]